MRLQDIHSVYFIGIGGIGMSAIARWFSQQGKMVAGYDRVSTPLTLSLENEGIKVHYEDDIQQVPQEIREDVGHSLIVYTPAIPVSHKELRFFQGAEHTLLKRSEVLGVITKDQFTIGVAGTHGKTTTSSMIAHILHHSGHGCNAFIGGIMTNYQSNLIVGEKEDVVVVEADEFDRSFLRLFPNISIVTSVDPDHLDIYGDEGEMITAFNQYVHKTDPKGSVILSHRVHERFEDLGSREITTYGDGAPVTAENVKVSDGVFQFDYSHAGKVLIEGLSLQVPGFHNMENCLAAITACLALGIDPQKIREAVASYQGVKRRFEYIIKSDQFVFIDDYAHHPGEIEAFIRSVRALFPEKKLTAIFQPHLFSRTKDFVEGFAQELGKVDELILLDIYPAREEPIPGVTSDIIFNKVELKNKVLIEKDQLMDTIKARDIELLVTIGAGDIDREIPALKDHFNGKEMKYA